jgi:hypothetical protein
LEIKRYGADVQNCAFLTDLIFVVCRSNVSLIPQFTRKSSQKLWSQKPGKTPFTSKLCWKLIKVIIQTMRLIQPRILKTLLLKFANYISKQSQDKSCDIWELSRAIRFFNNSSFSAKLEHSIERYCLGSKKWHRMKMRIIRSMTTIWHVAPK